MYVFADVDFPLWDAATFIPFQNELDAVETLPRNRWHMMIFYPYPFRFVPFFTLLVAVSDVIDIVSGIKDV